MKKRVNLKRKAEKRARKAAKKAAKQTRKPSSGNRAVKRDVKVKTMEERLCWKLVGMGMIALAVFLALAFASFDWQAVRALCEDPHETTNQIGVIGNAVAYGAYATFGLAAWCFPLAFLMGSPDFRFRHPVRLLWGNAGDVHNDRVGHFGIAAR